jgi:hypothetical protein
MVAHVPIPPLAGLRAFEAVARLKSFRRAAEELSVTTSAVSRQVRGLEQALDIQLFERGSNGVTVTSAGRRFLPEVQAAQDRLSLAIAERLIPVCSPALLEGPHPLKAPISLIMFCCATMPIRKTGRSR